MNTHASLAREIHRIAHLTGTFKLRSGVTSHEYFDKYRFEAEPAVLKAIAEQLAAKLPPDFDVFAGLEMGGIPIAVMLSQVTRRPALFIRKKAKDYGTCQFAEGGSVSGRRLLIVEDVVTSGGQVVESVRALRGEGAIISAVVCVIDRQAGGSEALAKEGLALTSLFKKSDFNFSP